MAKLTGIPASPGVAIGRVFPVDRRRARVPRYHVQPDQVPHEIARLDSAVKDSVDQLQLIRQSLGDGEQGDILDAHRMMADDPTLLEGAKGLIRDELLNAEWAVRRLVRDMSEKLGADGYLAERRADLDEVGDRIVHNLIGEKPKALSVPGDEAVIVAYDLPTAEAAVLLASGKIRGLVTDFGSKTSHTAILARALEVPCVVGAGQASEIARAGDAIALDGNTGEVLLSPDAEEVQRFEAARAVAKSLEAALLEDRDLPAQTLDGVRVSLQANIEFPEEVPSVLAHGGEGVGLYRTEFLYLNREELPSEEEHFYAYSTILERMQGRPVTIRTLDLGGDKLPIGHRSHEPNPALGLRAIRFTLRHPQLFRTQARALLRASVHGNLQIMLPMIAAVGELRDAKAQIEAIRLELLREGRPVAERIPVGIMLETPAAALAADRLARECDFFSIGTNDLIQYSLAIDRGNRDVAYLYRPLHLGVLRLIQASVDGAKAAGIACAMCGEMAGDPAYALVLLALGLDELSMNPADIPKVKRMIRSAEVCEAKKMLAEAMAFSSHDEIERYVLDYMHRHFPQLIEDRGTQVSDSPV
ncbi:MAG TPA: phosphoenolpyruvate--protein phosphotransferase [Myxococcales bacterium]|nr:phosphoenolpyruvate--protein phosphotransferase [Myxococcales bacterium]